MSERSAVHADDRREAGSDSPTDVQRIRELCHDLRHHVATIATLVEAVAKSAEIPPSAETVLSALRRETTVTRQLCEHLSQRSPEAVRLRADRMVREVVEDHRPAVPCELRLETEPATLRVPPMHLRRVVENLLHNACHAAGPDGIVAVSVRQRTDRVIIEVSDSGTGFPDAGGEDVGLGLRIVHQLAHELDGQVLLDVSRLGGAAITVTLPSDHPGGAGGETG